MKKTSKNVVIDCSGDFSNQTSTGAGAGAGLASLGTAFAIAAGAAAAAVADTTAADYALIDSKLTCLNSHLTALGVPSVWIDGEWLPAGQDARQAAILALQLHRRKLRLVRDEAGAVLMDCDIKPAADEIAVVWSALRASLHGRGGTAYEAALDSFTQYETWRQTVCEDDSTGESTAERANRRAKAFAGVVEKLIADDPWRATFTAKQIAGIIRRHKGGESAAAISLSLGFNKCFVSRHKLFENNYAGLRARVGCNPARAEFIRQLTVWFNALQAGATCEAAARAAAFPMFRDFPLGATHTLVQRLKKYGFTIPDASWRVKLPRVRRWFKRPAAAA